MFTHTVKLLAVAALAATVLRAAPTGADELQSKAAQGDLNAQWQLAAAYDRGSLGLPQDSTAAVQWYRKAAGQGSLSAAWQVGRHFAEGWGVQRDLVEAYAWLELCRVSRQETDTPGSQYGFELNLTRTLNFVADRLDYKQRDQGNARARELWIELYRARNHSEPATAQIPEFRGYVRGYNYGQDNQPLPSLR